MKNIEQKLKQSSFSIFTIIVLALTAITVFWFNNIVTTQMPNGSSNTSSTVQQSNGQMQEFNADIATSFLNPTKVSLFLSIFSL